MPPPKIVRPALLAAALLALTAATTPAQQPALEPGMTPTTPVAAEAVAIFAGGCFWCVEADFDHVPGVRETVSGFTGGDVDDPTYRQVTHGDTGHREAVRIVYDPTLVGYEALLDAFWHSVDPTDGGGQFCDRGDSYATAIYATTAAQLVAARASKAALETSGALPAPVVTGIAAAGRFWPAEESHQDYYGKHPFQYRFYRWNCGRDARLDELWGDAARRGIEKGG
jgi:peptide-methionine (S)-S-oxide reductase